MKRLFTFSRAVGRLVWAFLTRQPVFVSAQEAADRLNVCVKCEHFETIDKKCLVCKCYVDAKTLFATETCPEKRWRRLPQLLFK
jgi:hypothetical protein